mgnify:FL=1
MSKKHILSIKLMCDSVFLMWAKFNFRIHSWES